MQQIFTYIRQQLQEFYPEPEIKNIASLLVEKLTGMSRTEILINKGTTFSEEQRKQVFTFVEKLKKSVPVQYVLGEAAFFGLNFKVNESTLIPRPETEELVEWILSDCGNAGGKPRLLDIGTGSGCIPIALKKYFPSMQADAFDISEEALALAAENAARNAVDVRFRQCDILKNVPLNRKWDIIVSNPPYVPEREKANMAPNVLAYEPALALFVPDETPLLFYEKIALFAQRHLENQGRLYFEIHFDAGKALVNMLYDMRFRVVELRKDLAGNDRMIKAAF